MGWHRDQWPSAEALGWQLQPKKDARLLPELKDKVAQMVRLRALLAWLDEEMSHHAWAWAKGSAAVPPRVADSRAERVRLQIKVDLLTAIPVSYTHLTLPTNREV